MKPRILVVADDASTRATLARWLLAAGYALELSESTKHARDVIAAEDVALTILAPDRLAAADDLAHALADANCPIVLIEENAEGTDAQASLTIPASSSISKPLTETDVLARVAAVLSEAPAAETEAAEFLRFEGYTLDVAGRACLDPSGTEVSLTRAEFSLLLALARRPGRVLSREELRRAMIGRDAEPDDRSVDMLISRLRRKIEPDPKAPRMIITVPGEGYKLGVRAQGTPPPADMAPVPTAAAPAVAAPAADRQPEERGLPAPQSASLIPSPRLVLLRRIVFFGTMAAAAAASWLLFPGKTPQPAGTPIAKFDASVIPMVADATRAELASYEHQPEAKAIAISREGWGLSFGAADIDSAKNEALERCRDRDKGGYCRLYAVGNNVVWSQSMLALPLAADVRDDMQGAPLTSDDLTKIWQMVYHVPPQRAVTNYLANTNHKALAVSRVGIDAAGPRESRAEAVRLAIEHCSDFSRAPCLLLSVDGLLTFPLPQSHRLVAPFTLAGERDMTDADRQRIAAIYGGKDWRALAKGHSGQWYAVSGLESERAAVEEASKSCRAAEPDCELYAIGNFRVAPQE